MRIYSGCSVSGEFEQLGADGFTGTLNDRQFAQLGALGLTGTLADRFGILRLSFGESATSGDMNSGGDNLKLSGDMTDGNDLEKTRSV